LKVALTRRKTVNVWGTSKRGVKAMPWGTPQRKGLVKERNPTVGDVDQALEKAQAAHNKFAAARRKTKKKFQEPTANKKVRRPS